MDLRTAGESVWVRATVGVGVASALVVGGLVGLTVQQGDAARDEAAAAQASAAAQAARPVPAEPSASSTARRSSTTSAASSTPTASATAPGESAVVPASNEMAAGVSGLFDGARYAKGAKSAPSTGGVVLSTPYRGALTGTTIVVDPGHNGRKNTRITNRLVPDGAGGRKVCNTAGTSTKGGYTEYRHNWQVGVRLAAELRNKGAKVVLTRPNDAGVGPCVDERAAIGNRAKANLVISIHADGAASSARGFHIIRSSKMAGGAGVTTASARAATVTRDTFAQVTGLPRSTYLGGGTAITPRRDIAGMNTSRVPAIMLEAGNMRNAKDAALLTSPAFQAKEAAALATSAQRFLGR